jgi:anti-anti-sigma factor
VNRLTIIPLRGPTTGFRIEGQLDYLTVPALEAVLRSLSPAAPVVLDMAGIRFMDSRGLSLILRFSADADGCDPALILRNPSPEVRRLLRILVPIGVAGVQLQFDGAGPGAAHRLSLMLRETCCLHADCLREHRRAADNMAHTRDLRDASASRRMRAAA